MWYYLVPLILLVVAVIGSGICFFMAFYSPKRKLPKADADRFPPGKIYEPYHPRMREWMEQVDAMSPKAMTITSYDGLTLRGQYYELSPDSPVEILFHGYRGLAERDLCGAIQRCFAVGHSVLLVDQRAGGRSEGHVITFGVKESLDVPVWAQAVADHLGADRPVIIGGVSMGASTVMLAVGHELPPNVVGALADCGYTNAPAIIKKVIREMHLPANLLYPLVRLGALLYGGFDPNNADCAKALQNATVPVIFFHGDNDAFVPCEMSHENHAACVSGKQLIITPGAGHGLCYPADEEGYIAAVRQFDEKYWRK